MMIFVGAPQNGTILRELIEEQNHLFRHIPVTDNKIDTTEVNQHKSDYVIVDLCCFDDLSFMQLENLLLAINSEIILYATGYTMQSSLINKLSMNGFDLFLLAPPYSEELKEELHVILHGTDFILKDEEAAHVKAQTCISTTRNQKKGVKIGIAGVTSRMGTTTTSLQLIRYLQRMGYKACYIEVNYTKFVQEQIRFEQPLHDAHLGMATIDRMDLFYRKEMLNDVYGIDLFADKAYIDKEWSEYMQKINQVEIYTPIKLKKGQKNLDSADKLFSSAVAQVRQPIESFFNWINKRTRIQEASLVRSTNGLLSFVYARIAACFI